MEWLIRYIYEDPLRILYFFGGSGGIWFWIDLWRGRIRANIRPLEHTFDTKEEPYIEVQFRFEVVNVGDNPTSLFPDIYVKGFDKDINKRLCQLTIQEEERILPPHSTRTFSAVGKVEADYIFWIYKNYRVVMNKGRDKIIWTRSFPDKRISFIRYDFELTLFRRCGWLPFVE